MELDDWLDYVPLQGPDISPDIVEEEELLCFRKRGRGCMDHRITPRLPLRAMIQRMKLLDDSAGSGKHISSKGRARILQDRARASRPHGLKQKKEEKEKHVKREVTQTFSVDNKTNEGIKGIDRSYHQPWKQNEFPSLGIEHTTEGSPKKKLRNMFMESHESKQDLIKTKELCQDPEKLEIELSALSFPAHKIQQPFSETVIIKPKVLKKEKKTKFDFTEANQKLLQEFPVVKPVSKVLSLTQHNLEKFLRESDSESTCSSLDMTCSNSETLDDIPIYEKYAVTLDDIKKAKSASKVPPKVKGQMANLLEAMDRYCEYPETYFKNKNEAAEKSCDGDEVKEVLSNKNNESVVSNASVVSDLSNLDSPSENNVDIEDNREDESKRMEGIDDVKEVVETVNNPASDIVETPCIDVDNEIEKHFCNALNKCDKEQMECTENGCPEVDTYADIKSIDKKEECKVEMEKLYEKQKQKTDGDNKAVLDEIDLHSKPISLTFDSKELENEMYGFQKVVRKPSKKKASPKMSESNFSSFTKDKSVWRIYGSNAIQVDGLPVKCDISELQGMVAGFGTVIDFQVRPVDTGTSVRFKLHSKDACEYAVQCLDDTDCLFPESNCKLACHQLQT